MAFQFSEFKGNMNMFLSSLTLLGFTLGLSNAAPQQLPATVTPAVTMLPATGTNCGHNHNGQHHNGGRSSRDVGFQMSEMFESEDSLKQNIENRDSWTAERKYYWQQMHQNQNYNQKTANSKKLPNKKKDDSSSEETDKQTTSKPPQRPAIDPPRTSKPNYTDK